MPDDVPVDQPPRRVSEPGAWERWFWLWDAYVAVAYVAVLVLMFRDEGTTAQRVASVVLLTASVVLYATVGRRLAREYQDHRGPVLSVTLFVTGLVVLFAAALLVMPDNAYSLFWVCPMLLMTMPTRPATIVVVLLNLLPAVVAVLREGHPGEVFAQVGPVAALAVALSVFITLWVERIVDQSTRRGELIEELEASKAEVSRLSHEAGVTAERARLAGEIHDTLAQGFTSIITLVQAAESELDGDTGKARRHLDLAARTARENLAESRALVAALAPFALGEGSLPDAVGRQVARLAEEAGIEAVHRTTGTARPLPTAVEVVVLRAAQEALTNVRKHAGAGVVRVELAYAETSVRLTVCDDGAGYDPAAPTAGFGLRGMRARVEQVAGTLSVRGEPGRGTTLDVEVPA